MNATLYRGPLLPIKYNKHLSKLLKTFKVKTYPWTVPISNTFLVSLPIFLFLTHSHIFKT